MVSLGDLIDLEQNFDLYHDGIDLSLTFLIQIHCDKIDSSHSEMNRKV